MESLPPKELKLSKKRSRKKRVTATSPPEAAGATSDQCAREVQRLIGEGHSKTAVEVAKQYHKKLRTAESEAVLVDAYIARIRALEAQRMEVEAAALRAMVRERHPGSRRKLAALGVQDPGPQQPLDELVRPLDDATLPRERREEIEATLQRRLTDPASLAQCSALKPGHPLRTGAAALDEALRAVTSGPVSDDEILLPEISRRGPLAPWKLLVRAIAAFYRHDDEACEGQLRGLDRSSAPGRLAPVIRSMMGGPREQDPKPGAVRLATEVGGGMQALEESLEVLDAAFKGRQRGRMLQATRSAVQTCEKNAPDLVVRLRQHISERLVALEFDPDRSLGALGEAPLKNAYYWMLVARAMEEDREVTNVIACSLWEQFRIHAIHEGWFPDRGAEVATLYLRMAALLEHEPPGLLHELRRSGFRGLDGLEDVYADQPESVTSALSRVDGSERSYLHPDRLYQLASECDPDPRTFGRWLAWRKKTERGWKGPAEVAEAWSRALPGDPRPLLHLVELAEERGALKKALTYLEQAETLDGVNPEVGRARLRLLINRIVLHLRRRKPHLAEPELNVLSSLRQARESRRSAFIAALTWVCCSLRDDDSVAAEQRAKAARLLGSEAAAVLLLSKVACHCGLPIEELRLPDTTPFAPGETSGILAATVCAIGEEVGIPMEVPPAWWDGIAEEILDGDGNLEPAQLRVLAESALRDGAKELAFVAAGEGLARGGPTEARFLLLRAQSLPSWQYERRGECLAVAAELARRQGDAGLISRIGDFRRQDETGYGFPYMGGDRDHSRVSASAREMNRIIKREREARSYEFHPPQHGPFDFWEDDEKEDFEDDPDIPFEAFLDLIDELTKRSRRPAPKRRKRKAASKPPAEQGSLF